jgi:hypothetical protein
MDDHVIHSSDRAVSQTWRERSVARAFLRQGLSFPVLLGALLMGGAGAVSVLSIAREGDTWFHIAIGEQILKTHTWPTTDTYSFTAHGNDSIAYGWLGEIPMALATRLAGLSGLMALLAGLSAVFMLLLYYHAIQRCGNPKAAFVACLLLLPLAAPFFTLRPQLLGYIFLLITMISIERFRQGHSKALWILPPVFLVWANTHGSFVLGLMLIGVSWASGLFVFRRGDLEALPLTLERRRHLLLVLLLCVLALMVTPYGTRLAAYPFEYVSKSSLGFTQIGEYQPLSAFGGLLKWFVLLLLAFMLTQLAFRPAYTVEEVALLLLAVYAACTHARMLFFFVLIFTSLIAKLLARWIAGYQPANDHSVLNAALLLLLGVGLVKSFPSRVRLEKALSDELPVGAVAYLRQHPADGPMFNQYEWGGYLIWTLGSQQKVFIDGRSQLYEAAGVYADYHRIMQVAPETEPLLRKYDIKACLIARTSPLATLLRASTNWERIYGDNFADLYVLRQRSVATRFL